MQLALNKTQKPASEPQEVLTQLDECQKRHAFYLRSIRALLQFIKEFSFDLKELKSDAFKRDISDLGQKFSPDEKLKGVQRAFDRKKKKIHRFIIQQKKYLAEREKELKDIIDLLAKAMVALDTDNQQYNQRIYQQSEKIEQITRLDDIKKVKQALIQEIDNIRQTVRNKQQSDSGQLKILAKKVSTLNHELKKARAESVTDGLTGIYNRKAFDRTISEWVEQNTAAPDSFAVLMVDIDNFKVVNDCYGHQTGDRVLLSLAQKCSRMIRSQDFIARYGGEEFVIVLAQASLRNAIKKAKRICQTIAHTRYCLEDIQPGHTLSLTVSIGVSTYQKGDTVKTITDRADQALYEAKRGGKNRVASENDLTPD